MKKVLDEQFSWLIIFLILSLTSSHAQSELVPINHKVYTYFESLSKKQIIDYDNENIPLSRGEVASFLKKIELVKDRLTSTETKILNDLTVEFSFDVDKNLDKSISFLTNPVTSNIFSDNKQKYLYAYADSNATLFFDGTGFISYRNFNAQSFEKTKLTLAQIGVRLRGSLYNTIGYYLRMSNGQEINGDMYSRIVAKKYDPVLSAATKFVSDKYFPSFEGYFRYEATNHAFALMLGRDNMEMGNGYIDKLFISNNIPPFDFARLDINYKTIKYTFFYGNIRGDSLGKPLETKNIVGHRLDIKFSRVFRVGFYESIIISNFPISFTYLNPVSFLTHADYTNQQKDNNNALMGIDFELKPVKNIGLQFSLLIDDLNFSTITKTDSTNNDNKFGYQIGLMYVEPFGINDLTTSIEYTRLDPFVYSHHTNESTYTHWGVSIGHSLPPNSDEIAVMMGYNLTNRIKLDIIYKHQRSAEGFVFDSQGNIVRNYGGDVNRGDLDEKYPNVFLVGNRVNRDIINFSLHIEPIRQYFIDINYSLQSINKIYLSQKFADQFLYATVSIDF